MPKSDKPVLSKSSHFSSLLPNFHTKGVPLISNKYHYLYNRRSYYNKSSRWFPNLSSRKKEKKLKNAIFKLWQKKKYIDIKQNSFGESINLLLSLDNAQLWKHIYQYHLMQPHKQTHHNYTSPSIHVSHYVKRWAPIIAALTVRDSAPVPLELLLWVATIFFFTLFGKIHI